jgi:hypothetical protein
MTTAPPPLLPAFHITHWKAGSEWLRAVLRNLAPDRFVQRRQMHAHLYEDPLQEAGLYSPVYLHRPEFLRLITVTHRRVVVIRDLRDTLVSWYFSARYSHGINANPGLAAKRAQLEQLDQENGLLYMLEHSLPAAARIQSSWARFAPGEVIIRYEDLWADPCTGFSRVCENLGIVALPETLEGIVRQMSFEARSGGRKPGEEDVHSHFRKGTPGDWRNHFTPRLTEAFKARFADTLVQTGYETTSDW